MVNASLLAGAGGVLPTTDIVLAVATSGGLEPVVRKGDAAPGLAGYNFLSFASYLPADNGQVIGVATVRNATLSLSKTVVFCGAVGVPPTILAASGEPLLTDAGTFIVKTIVRPVRLNQPFGHTNGCIQMLVTFTDGGSQLVRFAAPQS